MDGINLMWSSTKMRWVARCTSEDVEWSSVKRDKLCSTRELQMMYHESQSWTGATKWTFLSSSTTKTMSLSSILLNPLIDETIFDPQMNCQPQYWNMLITATVIRLLTGTWVLERNVSAACSWPTNNRTAQNRFIVLCRYVILELVIWCWASSSAFLRQWNSVLGLVIG